MFKKIKAKSRETIAHNYKILIAVCFPFMISNFAVNIIINYFTHKMIWSDYTDILRLIILLAFLLLEFICIPLSLALIFKTIVIINSELDKGVKNGLKGFLNFSNIKKIILINFIPRLLAAFLKINSSRISAFNIIGLDDMPLFVLSLISTFAAYKFFACNYCFALKESSVIETITISFKIMRKNFLKYIALGFSFMPWALLIALILVSLKLILHGGYPLALNTYTPFLDAFSSFGYGVDLYLIPYIYLTDYNFLNDLLAGQERARGGSKRPKKSK